MRKYYNEYQKLKQIWRLLASASDIADELPDELQMKIEKYHEPNYTFLHCLRWGTEGAKEIWSNWSDVCADADAKMGRD